MKQMLGKVTVIFWITYILFELNDKIEDKLQK